MIKYIFLILGFILLISGVVLLILKKNKIIPTLFISCGVILSSVNFVFNNAVNYDKENDKDSIIVDISKEVGMDAINVDSKTVNNLNNKIDCKVLFKDGENIYLCDVKFENNERNYYFTSGDKTITLLKKE